MVYYYQIYLKGRGIMFSNLSSLSWLPYGAIAIFVALGLLLWKFEKLTKLADGRKSKAESLYAQGFPCLSATEYRDAGAAYQKLLRYHDAENCYRRAGDIFTASDEPYLASEVYGLAEKAKLKAKAKD